MQGVAVLEAGGCPRDGQAGGRPEEKDAGNGRKGCRQDALFPWRDVRNAARPRSAALRGVLTFLSAFAPGVALGNPLEEFRLFGFSGMPLLGSVGIILLMLIDRDARPILKKVPRRCAGVMLLGLLAGTAFLDFSRPALAVIAFAPWICFLVLLWGFIEFASIEWEKPRGTRAVGDAGVRGFGTEADLDSMVATYTQVAASTSSSGDSAESMDLNSILDSILWLPDGDSIPAPRAIGSPGTKAQEGARPGRGAGESLRPSGDRDSEEGSRR